jgi:hypothetical protein
MFCHWFDRGSVVLPQSDTENPLGEPQTVRVFPLHRTLDGWSVGTPEVVLVVLAVAVVLALAALTYRGAPPPPRFQLGVLVWGVAGVTCVVLLARVVIAQPGVDALTRALLPAQLAPACAAVTAVGGLLSARSALREVRSEA